MSSLKDCPDEIIQHLLLYVSPEDNLLTFQLLSRRLHRIANSHLLWKYYCHTAFKYWAPDHEFQRKLDGDPSDVNWKELFMLRKQKNDRIAQLFDGILSSRLGQVKKFGQICRLGYDAKDFLLDQYRTDDGAEDVLARRYYSDAMLRSIHRGAAIEEWAGLYRQSIQRLGTPTMTLTMKEGEYGRRIERCLGGIDMFFMPAEGGAIEDINDVSRMLDDLATRFRAAEPTFEGMSTRNKALALNQWLRNNNLTGLRDPEGTYRHLRNCLIGYALRDPDHDSLPIISVAIFCCIAQRTGIDAQCCGIPSHMHAVVFAPRGMDLDGNALDGTKKERDPTTRMFLDPFGSNWEVGIESLLEMFLHLRWPSAPNRFDGVDPISVVGRTVLNITETLSLVSRGNLDRNMLRLVGSKHPDINIDIARYLTHWLHVFSVPPSDPLGLKFPIASIMHYYTDGKRDDVWLLEKYIYPLAEFAQRTAGGPENGDWLAGIRARIRTTEDYDELQPRRYRRQEPIGSRLSRYAVGQVFRHSRYGHTGVITGREPDGRSGPVCYSYLPYDQPLGESAALEDHLQIITDVELVDEDFFLAAGAYFKRFDRSRCMFVE